MPRAVEAGLDDGVLYFTDADWFEQRRGAVAAWRGMVVSPSSYAKRQMPEKILRVQGEFRADFPRLGAQAIRKGKSSGQTAIGLAVALGASTVVLLGFDMKQVAGRSHHHDEYMSTPAIFAQRFVPAFRGWAASAEKAGVRIVNATPGSALREFAAIDLDEALRLA